MDRNIENLDWSLLQAFLTVAESGSLSGAARKTGQSQPTIGRQIKAVEARLGVSLFIRQPRGLILNETGMRLLTHAQKMRDSAAQISLVAAGQAETLEGVVRITASVFFSHHYMPEIIAFIRQAEPQIELELAPSDTTENLIFREADIAIRMYKPTQLDVIAKKLGAFQMGLFASKAYLAINGTPQNVDEFAQHNFVGLDTNTLIIDGMRALGIAANRETFKVRCDQQAIYWELVRAGCGVGVTQVEIGRRDPDMVQILPDTKIDELPVWLAAPEALRNTPRIRRVYDLLSERVSMLTNG